MTDGVRSVRETIAGFRPWDRDSRPDPRAGLRMLVYAALGGSIGVLVAGLEWISIDLFLHHVLAAPLWVHAIAPGLGLALTAVVLGRNGTSATSDLYIRAFHTGEDLPIRDVPRKMLGSIATIGSGGAAGLEGPSVFMASTFGQRLGNRLRWLTGSQGYRVLSVAGAAAGVAAVFRAPATGVLFALETPFQRDIARRALIPALISAAAAYLAFVAIFGVEPLLPIPSGEVRFRDEVFGALVLGLLAGLSARLLAWLWTTAKNLADGRHPVVRIVTGALVGGGALAAARALTGESFTLGPGLELATDVALDAELGLWVIAAAFALRALATAGTLGAGGVGGIFVGLVVQGLMLGRIVEGIFDSPTPGLYPVIGLAAVLGAGYRAPLAAVMFVAETTGRAEFVIPALLATAVSQSVMGNHSVSPEQVAEREGLLERRLRLPVREVVIEVPVLAADMPLTEVIDTYGATPPAQALPVGGEDGRYVGLFLLHDLASAMFEHGPEATVADAMRDFEPVRIDAPAVQAARLMGDVDSAVVAVVDANDRPAGIVTALTMTGVLDYDPDD